MIGRNMGLLAGGLLLTFVAAGKPADAAVRFRFVGGVWGRTVHPGWHRFWGGPSIGFYFAPSPVYIVDGYDAPSYYYDSDFWYSRPEFGLSLEIGGGGGYYLDRGFRGRDRAIVERDRIGVRDREFIDRDRGRSEFADRDRGRSEFIDRERGRDRELDRSRPGDRGRADYRVGERSEVRGHESSGGRGESRGGRESDGREGESHGHGR